MSLREYGRRTREVGVKLRRCMASRTAVTVSPATDGCSFTTRETVEVETPASCATRCSDMWTTPQPSGPRSTTSTRLMRLPHYCNMNFYENYAFVSCTIPTATREREKG